MGWLTTAQSLPFLLFTLPAGAWIDRVRRRPLMITTDLLRAALLTIIPISAAIGGLSVGLLCAIGFMAMTATVFFDVADQSYVPALVGRDGLVGANARLEASRSAGQIGGPGLAGLLVQLVTPASAIALNIATYLASAACLLRIETAEPPQAVVERRSLPADIAEGLRFVARHPLIRPLALCALIWNLSWFNLITVLVLFATREIGISPAAFGMVLSAQGVGALFGAVLASRLGRRLGTGAAILLGPSICAFGTPLIACAAPGATGLPLLMAGQFLIGLGPAIWVVTQLSLRQAITPDHLRGRVNATIRFITFGARPIGAALGGVLGSTIGLRGTVTTSAVLFIICLGPLLISGIPRLREMPAAVAAE
jgi:MFS family permease